MAEDPEDKFKKLEDKVDRLAYILRQIAVSQELMQQELRMMNRTLEKAAKFLAQNYGLRITEVEATRILREGKC